MLFRSALALRPIVAASAASAQTSATSGRSTLGPYRATCHGGGEMPTRGDACAKPADSTPPVERIARLVSFLEPIQTRP